MIEPVHSSNPSSNCDACRGVAPAGGYRPDLAVSELIEVIGALRRRRLVIDRLVCRYLADLADRIGPGTGGPMGEGYMDVFEVSERILGLGTRQTRERVRVGRALRLLPRIEQAFESGDMSFARVREITRVARPESEAIWLELGQKLPIRDLQRRVAEARPRSAGRQVEHRARSASPSRASSDHVRVVLELPTSDWILLQKALQTVRDRAPRMLTDAEAVTVLATEVLAPATSGKGSGDHERNHEDEPAAGAGTIHDPAGSCAERSFDDPVESGDHQATSNDPAGSRSDPAHHDPAGSRSDPRSDPAHHDPAGSRSDPRSDPAHHDPAGSRATDRRAARAADDLAASRDADRHAARAGDDPAGSCGVQSTPEGVLRDRVTPHDSRATATCGTGVDARQALAYEDRTLRDAAKLLQYIPSQPRWYADELCEATGLSAGAVHAALLVLELQGAIRGTFAGYYDVVAAA